MFRIDSADWMPKGYAILSPHPVDMGVLRLALMLDPDLFRAWLSTCQIIKFDEKAEGGMKSENIFVKAVQSEDWLLNEHGEIVGFFIQEELTIEEIRMRFPVTIPTGEKP